MESKNLILEKLKIKSDEQVLQMGRDAFPEENFNSINVDELRTLLATTFLKIFHFKS